MRPTIFDSQTVRRYLLRYKIASLPDLKRALKTDVDLTVFRKLKSLGYLSSYTHRGAYYSLNEIARFDDSGLWSHEAVWFSRYGTLLTTVEAFVSRSPRGFFANDLADALRQLVLRGRLRRTEVAGLYLYTSIDPSLHRQQLRTRQTAQSVPVVADAGALQVSPDELKAAILLFYSLLDEQQRRLYAGLESVKLGHGGDTLLADFLNLDAHTVARGRQQLLDHDVASGRTRRQGGGRIPTEKKRPK
jgi:hypothetical protein